MPSSASSMLVMPRFFSVASRHDAGVEFDVIREVARLLSADHRINPLGAPLVRVGAHGILSGLPEPVDVAAVGPHVPTDLREDEI